MISSKHSLRKGKEPSQAKQVMVDKYLKRVSKTELVYLWKNVLGGFLNDLLLKPQLR